MYAIVDIETTGGHASGNRIIEVAVIVHDGAKVVDKFETLINPECNIPRYITALTGIDNKMVESAPVFSEVAERLLSYTEDKVFLAHNVNFDYNFLQKEFALLGVDFQRKRLCSIRLSRKIFPNLPSYGLGNLCKSLDINIENRHRASGDALATAKLFNLLLENDKQNHIEKSLKRNSKESTLPPHIPKQDFDKLPNNAGVYYFLDKKRKIIYVGKAIDIKKRVASHFTGRARSPEKQEFINTVHYIEFSACGNELISLLLESHEIKRLWPKYNQAQKRPAITYGLYSYYDNNGYLRLGLNRVRKLHKPLVDFRTIHDGRNYLAEKVKEFNLCPKLCSLQNVIDACYDYNQGSCEGACIQEVSAEEYNQNKLEAIKSFNLDLSLAIIGQGRERKERSVVLIKNGKYLGYGFTKQNIKALNFSELQKLIIPRQDNHDIQGIIRMYLNSTSDEVLIFDEVDSENEIFEQPSLGLFSMI